MAVGGYKAVHEKKLKIGKDVFVIGIDEMDFSRYMQPPLTTISINVMDTGKTAAYDLISLLEGRPFQLTLHPSIELIRRESC
jgi:LacI family transcriptional regulator